ncbi:uncharacterized protein LOC102713825 [Oryza brachyantha]|uniref:uncharacterized protein LOC102713825 n=1 Tax=Oryza brachyantha TaxID=4533 RepID=UPI0007768E02|nr:uncharacterized protein LOC102713825 [Oryza brachyantha]
MMSTPLAVAAVGCCGVKREGDPKLVGVSLGEYLAGGEAMLVEGAAAEVARVVKVERKVVVACEVVMEDPAPGGVIGVASDSLYATGILGMVGAEGYGDGCKSMQELDGGGAGERMLGVEFGGFQSEAGWMPVPVGAAAAETPEKALDLATQHYSGTDRACYRCSEPAKDGQRARYCLPPLHKDGFLASGVVWSKLKGHLWWPGEIFDTSDASELALKHHKKGSQLVAYFGVDTFAWCDESQLKPFIANYSQMANQSDCGAFINSVNFALEEISRRILLGMCCYCLPEELSDSSMSCMVENSGLRDGVTCSRVTQAEILECFSPDSFLGYLKSLALLPGQGGDLLDLVIACSQLTSFFQSKGCHELASFQSGSVWVDDGMDSSSTKNVLLPESATYEQEPSEDKPKRCRRSTSIKRPKHPLELSQENPTSSLKNACDFDDFMGLNIIENVEGKRSGKRRKYLPSPEVHTADNRQDSWSGLYLNDDSTDALWEASAKMRPRRKQRSLTETCVPSSDLSSPVEPLQPGFIGPKKHIQLIERSIIHVDEQRIDEIMPTALVLSFDRSAALPSEVDLIRLFSRYGPLKESETEVHQNTSTVKVAFKRRVDAASAFSVVSKYGYFGPSLRSFRLVNMPFFLTKLSPENPGTEVPA